MRRPYLRPRAATAEPLAYVRSFGVLRGAWVCVKPATSARASRYLGVLIPMFTATRIRVRPLRPLQGVRAPGRHALALIARVWVYFEAAPLALSTEPKTAGRS